MGLYLMSPTAVNFSINLLHVVLMSGIIAEKLYVDTWILKRFAVFLCEKIN